MYMYPPQNCYDDNNQFSDNFWWKKLKWAIYYDFSHFTYLFLHCGLDNLESFSCILLKFVLHVANNQFSNKFTNGGGLLSSVL